jgi:hypothetical protein
MLSMRKREEHPSSQAPLVGRPWANWRIPARKSGRKKTMEVPPTNI